MEQGPFGRDALRAQLQGLNLDTETLPPEPEPAVQPLEVRLAQLEEKMKAQDRLIELGMRDIGRDISTQISKDITSKFSHLEGMLLKAIGERSQQWETDGLPQACDSYLQRKADEKAAKRKAFWDPIKKWGPWVVTGVVVITEVAGDGGVAGAAQQLMRLF